MYIALSHIHNTVVKSKSSVRPPGLNPISSYLLQAILILDKLLYMCVCMYWSGVPLPSPVCMYTWVLLGGSDGKSVCLQCRRPRFNPRVGKIPWRREWQPTPAFLPGEFHGQGSLAGYSSWGHKGSDTTEQLTHYTYICTKYVYLCVCVLYI